MKLGTRAQGASVAVAIAVAALVAGCVPGGITPDGKHVFFEVGQKLVAADDDHERDVYERFNGKTTLVSRGQTGGNGAFGSQFLGVSNDGNRVFFGTTESLVNADGDSDVFDIYQRSNGKTKLISRGPAAGADDFVPQFDASSPDGSRVFFSTQQQYVDADEDTDRYDVYMRRGTRTTLLSGGASGAFDALYFGQAAGGQTVFFETSEALTSGDEDTADRDVYSWRDGDRTLISTAPGEDQSVEANASFAGASANGARVFFETSAALDISDQDDDFRDIYERRGNLTSLVSRGGNGDFNALTDHVSTDGLRVVFSTSEELADSDDDGTQPDVYVATESDVKQVSLGPVTDDPAHGASFAGASDSASRVAFTTDAKLTDDDADTGSTDVYLRAGNATTLVSDGPAGTGDSQQALFAGISDDGRRVFFRTAEVLVDGDEDTHDDVYRREGATTTLISRGKGDAGNEGFPSGFLFASADGDRAFFYTGEKLVAADDASGTCDDQDDPACSGYERVGKKTRLFSRGN